MIIKFSDSIIKNKPEVFEYAQNSFSSFIINWCIDSKYRTSVKLSSWLKKQVDNPDQYVKDFAAMIKNDEDYDKQIIEILSTVHNLLVYETDQAHWDINDKWQLAGLTANFKKGDCEDGAILIYVLARLKGITANRLLIFTGSVNGGSHCWLGYKPNNYPLNYSFIDWCYLADLTAIEKRNKFSIYNQRIMEYKSGSEFIQSNYYNIWFGFNEVTSYKELTYNYKGFI